ncbi:hypothetical protein [Hydrogenimonas sp.]
MSFKEIRLIRILMWILLYLVILFLLIFLLVIPAVKSYKSVNNAFVEEKVKFLAAEEEHETLSERLRTLRTENRKVIGAFEKRWDERFFVSRVKPFFSKVDLKPVDINETDRYFRVYEINVMTKMKTPQNFYRFLDGLPSIPYVIQADFPVAFRAHGSDEVEGVFHIRVYEEKRKSGSEGNRSTSTPLSHR